MVGTAGRPGSWDDECRDPNSTQYLGTFTRYGPISAVADACSAVAEDESASDPSKAFIHVATALTGFDVFYSADGLTNWVQGPTHVLPSEFTGHLCPDPQMMDGRLVVYFQGTKSNNQNKFWRIESFDSGTNWTYPVGVLTGGAPGSWDEVRRSPSVIKRSGTFPGPNPYRYLMTFWAYPPAQLGRAQIGFATSYDGLFWRPFANPIIQQNYGPTWNGYVLSRPRIIEDPTDRDWVHLFYAGFDDGRCSRMGYACSHDGGQTWHHLDDPVFAYGQLGDWDYDPDPGEFDNPTAYVPSLLSVGATNETLRMYYSGSLENSMATNVGAAEAKWALIRQFCPYSGRPASIPEATRESTLRLDMLPNPATSNSDLSLQLGTDSEVTVDLYDSNGRQVKTVVRRRLAAGSHRIPIERPGLVSGVYYLIVRTDGAEEAIRFVFLK